MNKRQIKNVNLAKVKAEFANPTIPRQRQYEALRAIIVDGIEVDHAASKFGYKARALETLLSQAINDKLEIFPSHIRKPKTRKVPTTLHSNIVKLRNAGMSAQEILEKLREENVVVSIRSVERILNDFGFPKLQRRTNKALGITKNNTIIPEVAENIDLNTCKPFSIDCPIAGVFFFLPYIIESGILDIIKSCPLPSSSVIGAEQACLSMLFFKLIGGERLSQIKSFDHEPGLGLFAGLNILPKSTYMSTYSCRCSEDMLLDLQEKLMTKFNSIYPELYSTNVINLDFHSIPHYGEESVMEKVWCGAKSKTMKGANTIIAHDSGTNAIMYTRTDILRSEEGEEIKKFIAFWKGIKGSIEETLVFDCRFTNYQVLDEISTEVKFITLRKRCDTLLQATAKIGEKEWQRLYLPIPKRKNKKVSVHEEIITLPKCKNKFRQITIKDHGRANPTYVITNDLKTTIKDILILYAKRWHVEQKIAELVSFFNMNALGSPLMIRIHFDVIWTMIADTLYHVFVQDLRRFEKSLSPTIFKKFINMPGKITYDGENFLLSIRKRAHTPVLLGVEKLNRPIAVPWLDGKILKIEWRA